MNSITIHRSTASKSPSVIIAVPLHKQIPITDEIAEEEAILILNWMGENLPGSVYDIVVKKIKEKTSP